MAVVRIATKRFFATWDANNVKSYYNTAAVILCITTIVLHSGDAGVLDDNYGRYIGYFKGIAHGVRGTVYAVDENTLFVRDFFYDGIGPTAYFWAGKSSRISPDGFTIPYPEDYPAVEPPPLQTHNNSNIILRLPGGKRIKDIKWLSVWCRRFTVNFGEVFIPATLDPPKPRILPEFKRLAHGLRSGNISILDARTFYIPNLHYDGLGPDAYFFVGNGSEPSPYGVKVPNEVGSLEPLKGYQGEDIEIQLPRSLTMHSIDWLAVWCVQYTHNFGHVNVPDDLDVPPALGQTKLTVSSRLRGGGGGGGRQGSGGRPTTFVDGPTKKPRRHQTWLPPQSPPRVFGSYPHTVREAFAPVPRYLDHYYYHIL